MGAFERFASRTSNRAPADKPVSRRDPELVLTRSEEAPDERNGGLYADEEFVESSLVRGVGRLVVVVGVMAIILFVLFVFINLLHGRYCVTEISSRCPYGF